MANIEYNIFKIQPEGLSGFTTLSEQDNQILIPSEISKTFNTTDNFIEVSFFTLDNIRLQTIPNYINYSVLSGDTLNSQQGTSEIGIDVIRDITSYGYTGQEVKVLYNFLDYPYSTSTNPEEFYIQSISPDRTEVRLISINLRNSNVLSTTNTLIGQYSNQAFTPDLHLYFGNNIFYSIVNIDVEEFRESTAVLLKLYQPLPSSVNLKARVNIVEKISDSVAFEVNTVSSQEPIQIPTLRGANFTIEVETQATEPSDYFNFNELFSFPTTNTYRQLNSLFNEKGAEVSIDYSDFSNFINFSSAEERLRNFKYKLELLQSYQSQLNIVEDVGTVYTGNGSLQSAEYYKNLIQGILNNFDHYERHLFYDNKPTSWPKSNNVIPYENEITSSNTAIAWYNTELQDAVLYDAQNPDILTNTIPSFLREDSDNRPYELFIHMIAQHFDNLWIYTQAVTSKYQADNRVDKGVSKDLVEELLKNFGVKLYTSNRSATDLFKYFTANSYENENEYLPNGITTSGQNPVSQNDYQKEIYKRIYHNLPLLMKSKGTERGLRALINCFGIPSDILSVKLYGGRNSNVTPFYAGEQPWTGSIDKVRLDNTGSVVEGDTLSLYTGITENANTYTQDLHRVEIGFSPTDNINNYIVSQSAVLFPNNAFNIDDYIGDPRDNFTNSYFTLGNYMQSIFDGVNNYDLKDFIRLIKFFDNVLFRMLKDFVPARTVTDTGIIIKPHLLERSKHISPNMTWSRPEYSGSIDTGFISGSEGGVYPLGYSTNHSKEVITPTGAITKIWASANGTVSVERSHEEAKFDGELQNSKIVVSNGELNDSNPYKQIDYPLINYDVLFLEAIPDDVCIIQAPTTDFILTSATTSVFLQEIFSGTNNLYNFSIDSQPVITSTFEFSGGQYVSFTVNATHQNLGLNNLLNPGQPCSANRTVKIVVCDLSNSIFLGPPVVSPGETYNIEEWFNTGQNTLLEYFVNESFVSNPTSVNFNNISQQVQSIPIEVRDIEDNSCSRTINIPFSSCPLYDQDNIPNSGLLPNITVGVDSYFSQPYGFSGTTLGTQFSFKLRARYLNTTYISPTFIDIDINEPGVPRDINQILSSYPNSTPLNSSNNPLPTSEISTLDTFEIQFRATNNIDCQLIGSFRTLPRTLPQIVSVQRTLGYKESFNQLCSIVNFKTRTIYVSNIENTTPPTAELILNSGIPIFTNSVLSTNAARGYYFTLTTTPSLRVYRYWDGNQWLQNSSSNCSILDPGTGIESEVGLFD